jgi:hypothetical protein
MYCREIGEIRPTPIENGKPLQGTWTAPFSEVDLLAIQQPYGIPLPKILRDSRIKEWETFIIQDDRFCLFALLANLKVYRWAQVVLYDKNTKERLRFRKMIPFSGWRMPRSLANGSVDSRSWGFFFRIHDWLDADTIKLDMDIEATRKRLSFTAHVEYVMDRPAFTPMTVSLLFDERRSMYAFKTLAPVRGDMVFGGRHIALNPEHTTGFFGDFKGYYPYLMQSVWCTGMGFDEEKRRFGFSVNESPIKDSFKNNENALWIDGRLTPLPPVKITRNGGSPPDWIIQDMEGMVDLVFTPQEMIRSNFKLFLTRADYETPLGFYNGSLIDSQGEKIRLRNLWGMGERLYLRV